MPQCCRVRRLLNPFLHTDAACRSQQLLPLQEQAAKQMGWQGGRARMEASNPLLQAGAAATLLDQAGSHRSCCALTMVLKACSS